jgi:hypothetical protein
LNKGAIAVKPHRGWIGGRISNIALVKAIAYRGIGSRPGKYAQGIFNRKAVGGRGFGLGRSRGG